MANITEYHRDCEHCAPKIDAQLIINDLLKGINCWAQDEDGVHFDCWDAYKSAYAFIGKPIVEKEAD